MIDYLNGLKADQNTCRGKRIALFLKSICLIGKNIQNIIDILSVEEKILILEVCKYELDSTNWIPFFYLFYHYINVKYSLFISKAKEICNFEDNTQCGWYQPALKETPETDSITKMFKWELGSGAKLYPGEEEHCASTDHTTWVKFFM